MAYRKVKGFGCKIATKQDAAKTNRWHPNLRDAKADCSSDSECTWILSGSCENGNFFICAANQSLNEKEEACVYEKSENHGKCDLYY